MANNFEPNKIDNNGGEEAFNRKLRQDIKATLDSVELNSRRSQIMAQIRQERATGLQPARPPERNRTGFRWSPAFAGGLAVLVVAIALIFVVTNNNTKNNTGSTQANSALNNVTPPAAQAVESGNKSAVTTAAATTTAAAAAGAAAPAPTNNLSFAATTAAATTAVATTTAAAATTIAAATTTAAATTAAPTTAAAATTAASASDAARISQQGLVYPASSQISVETVKANQFVNDFRAGLSDPERTRLGLQNINGFRYLAYNAINVKSATVLDFYQKQARQQQLKIEASQPRDDSKLKSQWLYLQNPANSSERYGIMLVEIKNQAAADAAFGPGKATVGDTIILFAVPN